MLFKCKMCGGDLEIIEGETIAVCQCCGSRQTLPKLTDDKKRNMYDRANHFRRNNEYDKAMSIYETILNEDTTDAESYWSLVLCKYGIEYVEDPKTNQRIPTCNRTLYTSVFADENYKAAIEYADSAQREIYEAEAGMIDSIQKGILEISRKEEPFDIFICYKETDASGRRTPDSVVAQEMYYALTQEGYKVFFSRITLENKLGTAYEPYIFAALNSAKVMVVVSTKKEHVNAVWVQNEWSRFLNLIEKGADKTLIPAYRDMDPYDLPEEFSHLQALDMSKLGFMQDLIHGIKKMIPQNGRSESVHEESPVSSVTNTAPLLERAFLFLEDENWESADTYCEKVLDIEPKNARAYLGKLLAELHVSKEEDLAYYEVAFDNSNQYQKVIRFADEELRKTVEEYASIVNNRIEQERLEGIYQEAVAIMDLASDEKQFRKASNLFRSIPGFRDADELGKQCFDKAEEHRKDEILRRAVLLADHGDIKSLTQAARELQSISGWREADEKVQNYMSKVEEIKAEQERKRLEEERQEELARIAAIKRERRKKIFSALATIVIIAGIAFAYQWTNVIYPTQQYDKAMDLIAEKNYEEAYAILDELGDFKDAAGQIPLSEYKRAIELIDEGKYEEGYAILTKLEDFNDAKERIQSSQYERALAYVDSSDYEAAYLLFQNLGDYKDCISQMDWLTTKDPRLPLKMTEEGDIVYFGSYEQNNDKSDGKEPIEWIVLKKESDKVLLLSEKGLVSRPYHKDNVERTWKNCSLRKWLKRSFIKTAFTEEEKKYIVPTKVSYEASKYQDDEVTDRVFILSMSETYEYHLSNVDRKEKATEYAIAKGAYVSESTGCSVWWVRSPSGYSVSSYGAMNKSGNPLNDKTVTVRPAMWVSLEDVVQETEEAE